MAPRAIVFVACAALCACQYPTDPAGTLEHVRGGTLRVGISASDPWVILEENQPPQGVEVELIQEFARTQAAQVEWVKGSESDLMDALHGRRLDVVIAGLTRQSVWKNEAALTRPYLTTQVVIGAPDRQSAERLNQDLAGVRIAVEANSPEAAKLAMDTDAIVAPVDDLRSVNGPAAVPDYLLDDLGLVRTDAELDEHEHAMAVSMGENAMLVTLERFLLDSERRAGELLAREGKP